MPAAATDKLLEVGDPGSATTLSAPGYTSGGTSITVGSTSNWPTATGVVFAMDEVEIVNGVEQQVAGTYNEYIGTVATGTSVTNVAWQRGSGDRNYSAGASTRVYIPVSAERENRIVEWGLVSHEQDGTLKDDVVDTAQIADSAVETAQVNDSAITTAKLADDAVTAAKINWAGTGANGGIWWEEIGRTTLSGAGDTISVASIPARKYLRVYIYLFATTGTVGPAFQFNADTGSNYGRRASADGGVEATQTSQTSSSWGFTSDNITAVADIINIATRVKTPIGFAAHGNTSAATAPARLEYVGKWANTTDQITRIDVINTGTGDFAIGSEVVVLGHD